MRLTLRTLLAWLDDTLSPGEVREIGKQVSESAFAKELVERVHRVTRQRRLTVPSRTGTDATDPNLVASYLDNELAPDLVTEFEKRCLTSDVHLAEVASVHQILSLIGQKAKVPSEARHRMYHLVKGRESLAPREPKPAMGTDYEPISEPIQPWVTPEPPRRPWYERFGPAAAVVLLIIVLCWSAWQSLSPPEHPSQGSGPIVANVPPLDANLKPNLAGAAGAVTPKAETKATSKPAEPETSVKETGTAATEPAPKAETEKPAPDAGTKPKPGLPSGAVGIAEKPSGVLLRYNSDSRQWEQITAELPLKDQDRILGLSPFRSTLTFGTAKVDLVGETELLIFAPLPGQVARFHLNQGRVVLYAASPAAPFAVQFAKKTLEVTPPTGSEVGLERLNRREPGATIAADPILRFFAADGDIALQVDDAKETLPGPGSITLGSRGTWTDRDEKPAPSWVVDPKLSPYDQQVGEQFQKLLPPDRPLVTSLVDVLGDGQNPKDIRRVAISALRAAGDIDYIVPMLKKENPVTRRAAIAVLRAYLGQGADASQRLHKELGSEFGDDLGSSVEKLLVGFTAKEARDQATYNTLVKGLSSTEVAVRELALENLMSLTGRDDLGYDPDQPEGKGLNAWTLLSKNKDLHAVGAPKGQARPAGAAKGEKN